MKQYRCNLTEAQIALLENVLHTQQFEFKPLPYGFFQAKHPVNRVSVSCYHSLKCLVQGKDCEDFVRFTLEPEVLKTFELDHPKDQFQEKIGMDEAGKGDYFGPLAIASVFVPKASYRELKKQGVDDSKKLSDQRVRELDPIIRARTRVHTLTLFPEQYNLLYTRFQNLNRLLAWAHCTCLYELLKTTPAKCALLDHFGAEKFINEFSRQYQLDIDLVQRPHAESDLAVASASIIARSAFLEGLAKLGKELGDLLPKGAGKKVNEAGLKIKEKYGLGCFRKIAKIHFKTSLLIFDKE